VKIQSAWRGFVERRRFLAKRRAALTLQAFQRGRLARRRYAQMRQACAIIQRRWRALVVRRNFQRMRQSALVIQSYFRMELVRGEYRVQLEQMQAHNQQLQAIRRQNAAIILQHCVRGWLVRRRYLRRRKAALTIQSFWRGHCQRLAIRKAWGKRIADVQNRLSEAHKNATEDKKLCNRTAFALDFLYKMKDMAYLIEAVNSLDVSTRHSVNSCMRMTEDGLRPVRILMDLVHRCNRSLPHMEVVTSVCEVMISLSECQEAREIIAADEAVRRSVLKTSLEIMRIYREKNKLAIFSKLCAFLWKMSHSLTFLKALQGDRESSRALVEHEQFQQQRRKRGGGLSSSTSGSNIGGAALGNISNQVNSSAVLNSSTASFRPRSSSATFVKPSFTKPKVLSANHGMQLSNRIVRFHADPHTAISYLNKRLKRPPPAPCAK